jgi:hypothetical protein
MPSSSSSSDPLSAQAFAHKLAAQELAKYCREFSTWLQETEAGEASANPSRPQAASSRPSFHKPDSHGPYPSA